MRFSLDCWQQMIDSQQYRSVLMYKNKGPLSGGSLVHPHMQIVGLEQEDGYASLTSANFEGINVWEQGRISVNISTEPIMGFFESMSRLHRESPPATTPATKPKRTCLPMRFRWPCAISCTSTTAVARSRTTCSSTHGRPDYCQGAAALGGFALLCGLSSGPGQCRDHARYRC